MKPLGVRGCILGSIHYAISIFCKLDPIRYSYDVEDEYMFSSIDIEHAMSSYGTKRIALVRKYVLDCTEQFTISDWVNVDGHWRIVLFMLVMDKLGLMEEIE